MPSLHKLPKAYRQALAIQTLVYSDAMDPTTDPKTRCLLSKAWVELEERKRILRGKPLPGSRKPVEVEPKKNRRQPAPPLDLTSILGGIQGLVRDQTTEAPSEPHVVSP